MVTRRESTGSRCVSNEPVSAIPTTASETPDVRHQEPFRVRPRDENPGTLQGRAKTELIDQVVRRGLDELDLLGFGQIGDVPACRQTVLNLSDLAAHLLRSLCEA